MRARLGTSRGRGGRVALALSSVLPGRRRRRLDAVVEELRQVEATQRASLDALEQGVVLSTLEGQVVVINDAAQQILGYEADELTALFTQGRWQTYREDGSVLPVAERPIGRTMTTGESIRDEIVGWRTKQGRLVVLRVATQPVRDDHGAMTGVVTAFTDVTEARDAADVLRATQARFMALVERSSDIICLLGASGRIHYASPAAERILGYDAENTRQRFIELVHPDDAPAAAEAYADLLRHPGASRSVQVRLMGREGTWRHMEVLATNRLDDEDIRGIVANARDITERAEEAARLFWRAHHDVLTGLANRALLQDRLAHALERARRARELTAVLFLDLDQFKAVNDELGHEAGDRVLMEVADRLAGAVRTGDTVARLGGDEFVVLAETLAVPSEAELMAQRILDVLATPIDLDGHAVNIGVSVGIAFDEVHNPELLLREADLALYRAKHAGGGCYQVFEPRVPASSATLT